MLPLALSSSLCLSQYIFFAGIGKSVFLISALMYLPVFLRELHRMPRGEAEEGENWQSNVKFRSFEDARDFHDPKACHVIPAGKKLLAGNEIVRYDFQEDGKLYVGGILLRIAKGRVGIREQDDRQKATDNVPISYLFKYRQNPEDSK